MADEQQQPDNGDIQGQGTKQGPVKPTDLLGHLDSVPDTFGAVSTKETTRQLPSFNPQETPYFNATPFDDRDTSDALNAQGQPLTTQAGHALKQFGAGFAAGVGQGLANLLDVTGWAKDNYESNLMGLTTGDMQNWFNDVSQKNKILRQNPGSFNPGDAGWWMEQIASSGTGLGMGAFALAETAGIEGLTGGLGTGAAMNKLIDLVKNIKKVRGAADTVEAVNAVRDMKSAATIFGVLNRTNESRMEAMQSYQQIYQDMAKEQNADGSKKYTDDQLKQYAHAGATRTFAGNMALLPLDILAYRTMIYNPISGAGENMIERGLEHIGSDKLRRVAAYGIEGLLEGSEEGFQQEAQDEGKHYAQVLGGQDDGTSFLSRFGKEVTGDDFWNNFAGGVIGSPVIGGAMNLTNRVISGNRTAQVNSIHDDFVKNVGSMDNNIANRIRGYEQSGDTDKANILRRQFGANKAISALHLDATTDRSTAFDNYLTFLQGTLDDVNNGKTDSLNDLGFTDPTPEQMQHVKDNFQKNIDDANEIKGIYDNAKNKYNKNFVPEVVNDHYQLNRLLEGQKDNVQKIAAQQGKLSQFGELSANGKQQYNAEYELQSLIAEQSRLTDQHRETENEQEKENVNHLLEANKAKITDVKEKLNTISDDKEYTSKERNLDNDILNSALKDKDYSQLMYDKEHLENAIALQRKNISLWNNKQYLATKTKQSISKAKTVAQVQNTEEAAQATGEVDPEINEALDNKRNAINANAAATVVQEEKDNHTDLESIQGNANLFAEDNQLINQIKTPTVAKSTGREAVTEDDENQNQKQGQEQFLLSPSDFDFDNSSPEAKAQVSNGVKGLVNRLGGDPSFENLVRHVAKVQGIDSADQIFNALKYGWGANGYAPEDYNAIYDKIFSNPMEQLLSGTSGLSIRTPGQLSQATDKVINQVIATQQKPEGFDNNNQPIYKYNGVVTNESSPKMSFLTRLSTLVQSTDDDGNIIISHEYTEDELNQGDYVNSLELLDPEKFNEGTPLTARVPANFNDIKIPVYNADGTKGRSVTFGQYVSANNLATDSQEYKDKLPIILYGNGNRGVAFVHDIGWYHPVRFNQEFKGDMEKAIQNTRDIREAVINNKDKSADLTITGKRQTTFAGLKTKPNETVTLKEANPQTQLTVALTTNSLSTNKANKVFPNDNTTLVNQTPFSVGQVLDVRRYGKKDGKDTYIAFPVIKPKLDAVSKTTVLQAINIYSLRSNQNADIRSKHDPIVKNIQSTMGLDILSPQGLEKYLQHFITTFNTEKATTNQDAERQAQAKLAQGTPYLAFIAGGNIVIGKAGQPAYVDRQGNKKYSVFINPSSTTPSTAAINFLNKDDMIGWFDQNVSLDNLNRNKPVVTVGKDLNTTTAATSYNDYLLDRLKSNIKSHNIGTAENPNYITNIQPVITYDLNTKLDQKLPTNNEVKYQVLAKQDIVNTEDISTGPSDIEKLIIEQAKKDLGSDFGISKDNSELFSPMELTHEQRDTVANSINRIAGLTPDQQFDITDFMYNQVTAMVNLDTTRATKTEVDKQVTNAFNEVIKPLKAQYRNTVTDLEQKLEAHPALKTTGIPDVVNDYKYRISKIEAIEGSIDILKEEAFNRVAKYTGITENKQQTEQKNDDQSTEEKPDIKVEDEANDRERDFWTDILQENPESRISYSMRRFFGNIGKFDKTGKPVTGFLGLPSYTGADSIARTLMVTLADTPSDFTTMLNRLEERKAGIPWMQSAIDKLKGATEQQKQQFVTVMSNTSLRMKFTMISYNRKTNSWTTKVFDTHMNGVADSVRNEWNTNFKDSSLVIADEEGNYKLNDKKAQNLVHTFDSWTGKSLSEVPFDLSSYRNIIDRVRPGKPVDFVPAPNILQWLKTNVVSKSDRVKFSMKGSEFQVTKGEGNNFKIDYLKDTVANKEEVNNWLNGFGITLSPQALSELTEKGLFHNYQQRKPNELFDGSANTNGLFGILANSLKSLLTKQDVNFTEEGNSPLDNSVVGSLANLEAKYNTTNTPFGFRDNGKSFFALTANKFITDRVRDLKTVDSTTIKQLQSISFSQPALWLTLLQDSRFKDKFNISHIGANALKELGKRLYKDNAINKLADVDHELTKLGMFWDTTQGEVRYGDNNLSTYPGTSVEMRMATMFSPTMSDKHMMTLLTTAVLNLGNASLNNGAGISDDVSKILYEQTIKPELLRMSKFFTNGGQTNISGYDKGAGLFLMMPAMNNVEYAPGLKLIDAIKHEPAHFTMDYIEGKADIMKSIHETIKGYVGSLVNEKLEAWKKANLIGVDETGKINNVDYFDKKYKDKFRGQPDEIAKMAAQDYVINYMVANANSFMTVAGDPALYYKSKSIDSLQQAKDTFINAGKRLANQIAPGTSLSNSENEKYLQVFLDDRKSLPETPFLKFVTKINDGKEITDAEIKVLEGNDKVAKDALAKKFPIASGYFAIEGSDAQEYTTWKEHLDVMAKLGKTADNLLDITPQEIAEARDLFASGTSRAKLTDKQLQLIGKVLQPMKPVYTGQIHDINQDVMRTMYIKSSSFPLIPQLTAGMEIDALRESMESLENSHKMNVRASYQTANKVGSLNNPMVVWNADGTINQDNLKNIKDSSMMLDRKNFRIQQEIPFKSGKVGEDKITLGTQLMKLLFGDEIMNYDGFTYSGKTYSGKELHTIYNQSFDKLVQEKRGQLFNELGLDKNGTPTDLAKSMDKLQSLLKDEAVKRGYPLQDIEGLTLTKNGEFNLPLWASTNSNRYESMLNSIVSNRLIRMKFPGNSFVVGSEEGFIKKESLEGVDKSRIIFTSAWNGKSLQASYYDDGKLKKAQVLVTSKFKDNNGVLVDLLTKQNGEYKYVTQTETGFNLKSEMFDKDLLSLTSFRIPTSGHQSASNVEIAGFLPAENADLMIVPRNFTKQKGLDFDIDKENSYQLWSYMNENGSFEKLQEKHRSQILAASDKYLKGELSNDSYGKMINAMFGDDVSYTQEDIDGDKGLTKLNSKINEKLLQNEIIKINNSVLSSKNPEVQAKINKTLNTDYAEAQAEFIDGLTNTNKDQTYWTPLSDEYQKQKMLTGASGKIGTGAYSLDVVFHSLAQQASINGRPIQFIEMVGEGEEKVLQSKTWRFGNIESDGKLGGTKTLDGGRSISEVMAERQNIAVDNEKLQIMGRVNLNDITMDVDKVFNILGFDKGKDGNNISFLFLSQPVIKDFVDELKNANSNLADFEADKEGAAFDKLIVKYEGEDNKPVIDNDYWKSMSNTMTNENLITNIQAQKPDGNFQAAILRRFMEMRKYGIALRGIQTSINTDSKGLGKSFFDVIEKRDALNRLGSDSNMITGASGLIGDYIDKESITADQLKDLVEAGYIDIGDFAVKPDTLSGSFNVHGLSTAYNLWSKYFPYDAAITSKAFNEVLSIISSEDAGGQQTIEKKQEIFRGMKKYFSASKINGIINQEDDINNERSRLYIDSDKNTSLAKYIKTLRNMVGNNVVDTFIKSNKLINRLEFDIQKNGQPSLIKFNNASGEEFDEQYLYESLATLMEVRGKSGSVALPEVGNKKYTLDSLAQDLIAYAYLGNATQEAIQFTKYVPVSYLNTVGYSEKMRQISGWLNDNPNVLRMKVTTNPNEKHLVSEFTMQYIQHNPERVKAKFNEKDLNKLINKRSDGTFVFKDERRPTFVSLYDTSVPKGEKKFKLYYFDGSKYSRIPVLGMFGMDEYQPRNNIGQSIVNGKQKSNISPQATTLDSTEGVTEPSLYNIETGDSYKIMKSIADTGTSLYSPLAKYLLDYSDGVKVATADSDSFFGLYDPKAKVITINNKITQSQKLADTFIHEMVHHLTYNAVNPFVTTNEKTGLAEVSDNAPVYVQDMARVFNYLRANINNDRVQAVAQKVGKESLTGEEKQQIYGFTNIHEFMAMALTNQEFQKGLSTIEYKTTGQSILDKLKSIVANVLQAVGIKFDSNSAASHAINSIFNVIEGANIKVNENPFEGMYDETMNQDFSFLDKIDNALNNNTEPEGSFEPTDNISEKDNLLKLATSVLTDNPNIHPAYKSTMLGDVEGTLREAASQVSHSASEARVAEEFYGKDFTEIAKKMFPNENYQSKYLRDYINNLPSDKIEC